MKVIIIILLVSASLLNLPLPAQADNPEADLLEIIKASCPALSDNSTDYEKVQQVRNWAFKTIDIGHPFIPLYVPAPEMYETFSANAGGVSCQAAAWFLSEIYRLLGYKTKSHGYGVYPLATHVVTLVEIQHEGRLINSIQDATFNETYESTNGTPIGYDELMNLLKDKRHDEIVISRPYPIVRTFLWQENGVTMARDYETTYETAIDIPAVYRYLAEKGYPENLLYLYLFDPYILPPPPTPAPPPPVSDWGFAGSGSSVVGNKRITSLTGITTPDCKLFDDAIIESLDGQLKLVILRGTFVKNRIGGLVSSISVVEMGETDNRTYELIPAGVTFSQNATLSIKGQEDLQINGTGKHTHIELLAADIPAETLTLSQPAAGWLEILKLYLFPYWHWQ